MTSVILGWRKELELVWISFRLKRGFCLDSHGQILRDFTSAIEYGCWIKVRTDACVRSTQAPTHLCLQQSLLRLQPSEDWCWRWLIGACVDLPQALVLTIFSIEVTLDFVTNICKCHAMPCIVMSWHVMSCYGMSCHVMQCDVMQSNAMTWNDIT